MAQDGGGIPSARVAGSQPARPAPRGPGSHRDFITLAQPRPGVARKQNEYIETPLRPQLPSCKPSKQRLKEDAAAQSVVSSQVDGPAIITPARPAFPGVHRPGRPGFFPHSGKLPITAQPTVATFKKEKLPDSLSNVSDSIDEQHQESIICRQCRRCKCEACRTPRPLPSKWICSDKCLCSANSLVDHCSCMCCVKGLFYHWGKDYEMDSDVSCADQPCSCSPHKRILRWSCIGFTALLLPCLCCYWPLKGCVKTCEAAYMRYTAHGCRCVPNHRTRLQSEQAAPEKRLLDANSDC